jgi:hypothetical protein
MEAWTVMSKLIMSYPRSIKVTEVESPTLSFLLLTLRNQSSNLNAPEVSDRIRQKNESTIRLILERANKMINIGTIAARCLNRGNSYFVCDLLNRLAKGRGTVARFRVIH